MQQNWQRSVPAPYLQPAASAWESPASEKFRNPAVQIGACFSSDRKALNFTFHSSETR